MKKLEFKTSIAATPKKVWDTMLHPKTYREWVNASWPGSFYEGKWAKGEKIRFLADGQGGGMLASVDEFKPYETVLIRHIAVITADGSEDRDSAEVKGLIGTLERYSFAESKGITTLTVSIETSPEWESMFQDGWPKAVTMVKEICER